MAVPKRKTTRSRAGKRRSHIKFSSKNIIEDKKSGEYRLSHHIDLKTGYYKGTPFYGTWEERNNMCERMKQLIHEYSYDRGIKTIHWPLWYKNMSKELSFDVMEKPKSVHLSPQYYFYDMDKNDFNNNYHLQDLQGGLF